RDWLHECDAEQAGSLLYGGIDVGQPAAKQGDQIVATDTHIVLVPALPAPPVPTPLPHPFSGALNGGLSGDVKVMGKPAATVGSEFLGIGWRFRRPKEDSPLDIALTESGQVALSRYEEDVQEAIAIILGTSRGERVMRPDFGCGLRELVFAGNNATTAGLAEQ